MKRTHKNIWAKSPKEKNIFVSEFSHMIIPVLKKANAKKVLDVACGNGLGVALPMLRNGFEVYAFDHLGEAVKACKANAKDEGFKIRVKKSDMYRKFPYKTGSFDAVTCIQAIYHGNFSKISNALKESKRVLKKGGYFFATFCRFEDVVFGKKEKYPYFKVQLQGKRLLKSYLRPDKKEKHLFYYMSKDWEYNVPHYYFSKKELKQTLGKYFKSIKIKSVRFKNDKYAYFWFVQCRA